MIITKSQSNIAQFLKFLCVGALNTAIDFAILNILIVIFGTSSTGGLYIVFKAISFSAAVLNSYLLNKYWVFSTTKSARPAEPMLFAIVSGIGLVANVGISTEVFAMLASAYHVGPHLAANIGAVAGTLAVFIWNFIGYKFIVFTKQP